MQLGELMNPRVVTIGPDEPANVAWTQMRDRRIRHLVVTDDGKVVGVISERDLGGKADAARRRGSLVRDLMTPSPVTATPTTSLRRAATMMREGPIGSLPIIDGGALAGIVTATDVLDALGRTSTDRSRRSQRSRRTPDSKVRAPFPDRLPRAYRREAGRAAAPLVPTYIRTLGVDLSHNDREYIRRKLGMKLGKFATYLERISVRIEDVNGPKGGVDHVCRIKVVISGHPSVLVERRAASLPAAVNGALTTVERAVRRAVQRRRTTTTRGRVASARLRSLRTG